jgi:hypothetical protein
VYLKVSTQVVYGTKALEIGTKLLEVGTKVLEVGTNILCFEIVGYISRCFESSIFSVEQKSGLAQ